MQNEYSLNDIVVSFMIYPITISTNTLFIVVFFQHAQKHYVEGGPGTSVIPIKV